MKIRIGFRGWWFSVQKKWYSLFRYREMQVNYDSTYACKIIDIGAFYIVFDYSKEYFKRLKARKEL